MEEIFLFKQVELFHPLVSGIVVRLSFPGSRRPSGLLCSFCRRRGRILSARHCHLQVVLYSDRGLWKTPYFRNSSSTKTDGIHQTQPLRQSLHSSVIISISGCCSAYFGKKIFCFEGSSVTAVIPLMRRSLSSISSSVSRAILS